MSKRKSRFSATVLVMAGAVIYITAFLSGCGGSSSTTSSAASALPRTTSQANVQLKIEDETVGQGPAAKSGDLVSVNYTGTLTDGTKFDSSYDRGQPIVFTLGEGRVIPGWDQGIVGMQAGGKRKLTIPPDLAYGAQGVPGKIPSNSTLVFEVELVKIGQ